MGSHHDHNDHSNEKKPVSFTVPLIFGSVIVFIIILLVSIGDPSKGDCCCAEGKCSKECMDACKAGTCEMACCAKDEGHGHHGNANAAEGHDHVASSDTAAVSTPRNEATDTTAAKAEHKEEAHHH